MAVSVSLEKVSKIYKGNKTALSQVDLQLEAGGVYALLGKNGAGKSTLNKLVAGLIRPTGGKIEVLGKAPHTQTGVVGYLSENLAVYEFMTGYENLEQMYLIHKQRPDKEQIGRLLEDLKLANNNKTVQSYSLGMRRRLQIAMSAALFAKPIMILDEPTNGLDFEGIEWLETLLRRLQSEERTILLSTHSPHLFETLYTHYIILKDHKIAKCEKMPEVVQPTRSALETIYQSEVK